MNEPTTAQLDTAIRRLGNQQRRGAIDRGFIRSRLDPKQKSSGGGTVELVVFTAHTGTGGDENGPANFAYTFKDHSNVTHSNVAPSQQRPKMTLLAGTIGEWDNVASVLVVLDEVPQTAVCSTSPALLTVTDTPFFGF